MKTKKLLGMLLALTMVFSMVIIPQAVVNAEYSDNVLLEYDFENYTGSAPSVTGTGVSLSSLPNQNQSKKLFAKTENGNTYLYTNYNETAMLYEAAGSTYNGLNVGFRLGFDETFTTGKYAVSFDFSMKEDALPEGDLESFMIRDGDKKLYLFAANADNAKVYGYKTNANESFDTAGTYGGPVSITPGTISRVDLVFDLDSKYNDDSTANGVVSGYVDGKLFTKKDYTLGIASKYLYFYLLQEVSYFDNLKVAKIEADSFEADATYANNTATINFTESLLTEETALDASDFTVTNAATGEAVAVATATKTAYDEVTLAFADGAIKKGFTYNVAFSSDVKNIAGNAVTGTASFALPAEEKTAYIEDFTDFKDGDIVVENYEDFSYNNFMLLINTNWTTNNPFKSVTAVTEDDVKAIRITRGKRNSSWESNTHSDTTAKLPHKIYLEGDVSVEYRIRASEDLASFKPYLIGKNAKNYELVPGSSIPGIFYEGKQVKYSTAPKASVDGGFHTYKIVYHFDDETADVYFDGGKLNEAPIAIFNFANIKEKGYFDRVDMRLNGTNDSAYVDIDYIKVTQAAPAPYVKNIAYKDYQGNATTAGIKEIAVSFGGNVSEASLENIAILDGETPVKYDGAFDATTRTYTMTIPSLLAGGKTYSLDLAAVADPYAAAIVGEKEFAIATTAGAKEPLTVTFSKAKAEIEAGDKVVITATIIDTTGACAENYALIGAVNNGGTLSNVDLDTLTWDGFVGTAKANITVESTDELSIKAFVLESLSTLAPVALSPFELN